MLTTVDLVCFFIPTVLALVSTPLFEFRYFIVPSVMISIDVLRRKKEEDVGYIGAIISGAVSLYVLHVLRNQSWNNEYMNGELSRYFW